MHHIVSKLLMYGDMDENSILMQLADICEQLEGIEVNTNRLRTRLLVQVKRLLQVATDYGFNHNLWHNYLAYLLITNENPFSITCEKVGAQKGTVNEFVKDDFAAFRELFDYDFTRLEERLSVDCFTKLSHYTAIQKTEFMYNRNVSDKVQTLSFQLEKANSAEEFFDLVTDFYRQYGVGMFGLNKAFRITHKESTNTAQIIPINNMDQVVLSDLIGYEYQKQKLVENTKAFVEGYKANNVLLFGDSGTGKSTSIKAIVNEFYDQGLRMIEIYKHQFKDISNIIAQIKHRNYKFIIYMDDLSFEEFEIEYKFLKAVIEGGVETRPDNILIYATSNRRNLIKETWSDRNDVKVDNGIHQSDTIEEKTSLAARFGLKILYMKPSQQEYFTIVEELAKKNHIQMDRDELLLQANQWELRYGGFSGRTAQQFINHLLGTVADK